MARLRHAGGGLACLLTGKTGNRRDIWLKTWATAIGRGTRADQKKPG